MEKCFLVLIQFLILTITITYFKVPKEWIFTKKDIFDYIGALIFEIAISYLTYGVTIMHSIN